MKKILLAFLVSMTLTAVPSFSQGIAANPGSFSLLAGVGFGYGLGFYGGAEYGIVPLSFGSNLNFNVSARAVGAYSGYNTGGWNYSDVGIGGYGVLHYGLKQLKPGNAFLDNLDFFLGLGLSIRISSWNYDLFGTHYDEKYTYYNFGYTSGVAYYFNPNFAVSLDYNSVVGSTLGIVYTF